MHSSISDYVLAIMDRHGLDSGLVVDVGSQDVNGNIRHLFDPTRWTYIGVDIAPGPNVDRVIPFGEDRYDILKVVKQEADLILYLETAEHDPHPWKTMQEINRALRHMGTLVMSCRGIFFPRHDYPSDYWRFTDDGIRLLITRARLTLREIKPDPMPLHPGWLAYAQKVVL